MSALLSSESVSFKIGVVPRFLSYSFFFFFSGAQPKKENPSGPQGLSGPPLLAMGFLGVSMCRDIVRYAPPQHANLRCDTPRARGYLSDTCAISHESKGNGCDAPKSQEENPPEQNV